ncbi:cytochrome c oxidase assembly protein [Tieghemostelium lacteum]|uniref:Cytochrome c oxidase assembly protein n=1 Tax=Tieghemostelium lacteum TaxID=361077 RepID=A0A151ZCM7_TIELA|nr:cytochrome c oxidase assembly protein [Tieghemostelium lacteum]|eukprot:KYQ91703.1 cytochrome c oxidase assembly protein [Tieghemostelium lacteum]
MISRFTKQILTNHYILNGGKLSYSNSIYSRNLIGSFNNNNKNIHLKSTSTPLSLHTLYSNNNEPFQINRYFSSNSSNNNNNNSQEEKNNQSYEQERKQRVHEKNKSTAMWVLTSIVGILGLSYAAVPLYRVFCRVTGYGGTVREETDQEHKKRNLERKLYPLTVTFTASTANKIPWTFKPSQSSIEVLPGEAVLASYRATNNTDKPIIGVATYNITPMKAGSYFTKIQCFCFDEQRINAHESLELPVLFVVEPEILDDKNLGGITDITLSYTFFKSNDQGELEEI